MTCNRIETYGLFFPAWLTITSTFPVSWNVAEWGFFRKGTGKSDRPLYLPRFRKTIKNLVQAYKRFSPIQITKDIIRMVTGTSELPSPVSPLRKWCIFRAGR